MVKPFKLLWPVGHSDSMNKEDIENTKQALEALGLYEPPQLFTERFSTEPMIQGLKKFQRQEGLVPDGVMNPEGPTHNALNRTLAAGFQGRSPSSNRRYVDTGSLGPNPRRISGTTNLTNVAPWQNHESKAGGVAARQTEIQAAAAPVIPFGVWLMQALGTATVALAMAIYNSWDKRRRKEARDAYDSATSKHDPSDYDFCHKRWLREQARCELRAPYWRDGCRRRANDRQNLCYANGGNPDSNEPDEWSDRDEEVSPPRRR